MTLGAQVFRTNVRYIGQYTQKSTGTVLSLGYPLGRGFWRMFNNYSYQRVQVTEINELYTDPSILQRNPFLRDSLLLGQGGERIVSKVTPSVVYNSIDQPIFPTSGKRLSMSIDLAGIGGNTNFFKPMVEGVWFIRQNSRFVFGMRGQVEYIHPFTNNIELPIFEKLFLGGEYSVRGYDIRTIGPADPNVPYLVVGGDKSLLFNFEEQFTIAGPVRLIAFYDAGQVQPGLTTTTYPFVALGGYNIFQTPAKPFAWKDFKTSTGLEIRFFMDAIKMLPVVGRLRDLMPKTVKDGVCQEVVAKDATLDELPILTCWPGDGGPYITFPLVFTRDPESGVRNIGTYRMQVFDGRTTGMHWQRHKGGAQHYRVAERLGKRLEVAVALGAEPVLPYCATAPMPEGLDELLLAGFLSRRRVEMVKCVTVDLEVPASSHIVLEGYVEPGERRREGPFGDHTGLYSQPDDFPVFHLTCMTELSTARAEGDTSVPAELAGYEARSRAGKQLRVVPPATGSSRPH